MPWQSVLAANMERVALIVIEEAAPATEGEISEAAIDSATAERELIGVGQIDLAAIADVRGAQSKFPAVDARAFDGDGEKEVGIVEIVVVEEVSGAGEEIAGVERPPVKRDGDAELVLLVAFAVKRDKAAVLIAGGLQERARNSQERGSLIEVAVKAAEDPIELRNAHRG